MKYTVVFVREAADQLAELWLRASDQERIAQAADELERQLRANPSAAGESRVSSIRIVIVTPLAAYIDVDEEDHLVKVWRIWRCGK